MLQFSIGNEIGGSWCTSQRVPAIEDIPTFPSESVGQPLFPPLGASQKVAQMKSDVRLAHLQIDPIYWVVAYLEDDHLVISCQNIPPEDSFAARSSTEFTIRITVKGICKGPWLFHTLNDVICYLTVQDTIIVLKWPIKSEPSTRGMKHIPLSIPIEKILIIDEENAMVVSEDILHHVKFDGYAAIVQKISGPALNSFDSMTKVFSVFTPKAWNSPAKKSSPNTIVSLESHITNEKYIGISFTRDRTINIYDINSLSHLKSISVSSGSDRVVSMIPSESQISSYLRVFDSHVDDNASSFKLAVYIPAFDEYQAEFKIYSFDIRGSDITDQLLLTRQCTLEYQDSLMNGNINYYMISFQIKPMFGISPNENLMKWIILALWNKNNEPRLSYTGIDLPLNIYAPESQPNIKSGLMDFFPLEHLEADRWLSIKPFQITHPKIPNYYALLDVTSIPDVFASYMFEPGRYLRNALLKCLQDYSERCTQYVSQSITDGMSSLQNTPTPLLSYTKLERLARNLVEAALPVTYDDQDVYNEWKALLELVNTYQTNLIYPQTLAVDHRFGNGVFMYTRGAMYPIRKVLEVEIVSSLLGSFVYPSDSKTREMKTWSTLWSLAQPYSQEKLTFFYSKNTELHLVSDILHTLYTIQYEDISVGESMYSFIQEVENLLSQPILTTIESSLELWWETYFLPHITTEQWSDISGKLAAIGFEDLMKQLSLLFTMPVGHELSQNIGHPLLQSQFDRSCGAIINSITEICTHMIVLCVLKFASLQQQRKVRTRKSSSTLHEIPKTTELILNLFQQSRILKTLALSPSNEEEIKDSNGLTLTGAFQKLLVDSSNSVNMSVLNFLQNQHIKVPLQSFSELSKVCLSFIHSLAIMENKNLVNISLVNLCNILLTNKKFKCLEKIFELVPSATPAMNYLYGVHHASITHLMVAVHGYKQDTFLQNAFQTITDLYYSICASIPAQARLVFLKKWKKEGDNSMYLSKQLYNTYCELNDISGAQSTLIQGGEALIQECISGYVTWVSKVGWQHFIGSSLLPHILPILEFRVKTGEDAYILFSIFINMGDYQSAARILYVAAEYQGDIMKAQYYLAALNAIRLGSPFIHNGEIVTEKVVQKNYLKALSRIQVNEEVPEDIIKAYMKAGKIHDAKSVAKAYALPIPSLEKEFIIRTHLRKGDSIPEMILDEYKKNADELIRAYLEQNLHVQALQWIVKHRPNISPTLMDLVIDGLVTRKEEWKKLALTL